MDTSSTTSANDAVAYYNGCRVLYITDYVPPFEGKLEKVTGFEISNGMDIAWNAVENADSYYVTLENSEGSTVQEKTAPGGHSVQRARSRGGRVHAHRFRFQQHERQSARIRSRDV